MNKRDRTPYLEKRGEAFYFRRRLPYEANGLSNPIYIFSLRSDIPSDAREITARLTAMTTLAFDYARGCPDMDQNTLKALLTELVRFEIAAFEKTRLATGPRSLAAAEFASEREQAIQETLRQAIFLRDWEAVRSPLECVAKRLGVSLPDAPLTYATLALEALKVSIDISRERQMRDRGEYTEPSPIFSHAVRTDLADHVAISASKRPAVTLDSAFAVLSDDNIHQHPDVTAPTAASSTVCLPARDDNPVAQHKETTPIIPEKKTDVRDVLRSKNLLRTCSDETITALEKGDNITLAEAFDVYIDFKSHGCSDEWEKKQKPDQLTGEKWRTSSFPNLKVAKAIWSDLLHNQGVSQICEDEVDEAIAVIRNIPKNHGKWQSVSADQGYRKLIEQAQKDEKLSMNLAERELRQRGCTNEEEIRNARLTKVVPRIRVETYLRHVRSAKRIGNMLHALGISATNVFKDCSFRNDETKRLKATEDKIEREKWDDRFFTFLRSPVFQGHAKSEDDPLFWMPLLARCHGLRSEEGAQLGPDDVSTEKTFLTFASASNWETQ